MNLDQITHIAGFLTMLAVPPIFLFCYIRIKKHGKVMP